MRTLNWNKIPGIKRTYLMYKKGAVISALFHFHYVVLVVLAEGNLKFATGRDCANLLSAFQQWHQEEEQELQLHLVSYHSKNPEKAPIKTRAIIIIITIIRVFTLGFERSISVD